MASLPSFFATSLICCCVHGSSIGTGVVKIWRQVRALWEDGEKDEGADDDSQDE